MIPEMTLRDTFLPPFAAAVRAGALAVMVNSGEVNGIPGHVNTRLLNDVLRGELGFDGVIVSDWEDIKKLVGPASYRGERERRDARRRARRHRHEHGAERLQLQRSAGAAREREGAVPIARINDAVTRILTLKARVGLLDATVADGGVGGDDVGSPRVAAGRAARRARVDRAREELRQRAAARFLDPRPGDRPDRGFAAGAEQRLDDHLARRSRAALSRGSADGPPRARSALGNRCLYVAGATYDKVDRSPGRSRPRPIEADVMVLCLGEMSYAETPGNIDDL